MAWHVPPVAVTRFCQQPHLPAVGGTKNPDIARIIALAPDVVIVDKEENRSEDAAALGRAGIPLHVMHVTSIRDVPSALTGLAELVGRRDDGVALLPPTPEAGPASGDEPRAFIPIWRRPWMSINAETYGSSLLAAAGIDNIFAPANERYPMVSLEEASARRPNVVIAPSEPYPFGERHRAELEAVAPVIFVDGQDLFWWGARTAAAVRRLATTTTEGWARPPAG
jgi:ABC-type Fe3+-hydroxamate transport system substrate-binding protein